MTITKPMLAVAIKDLNNIKFPVIVSPKLDGIRCLIIDNKAVTRTFKPIPNNYIRNYLEKNAENGMDGELILSGKTFNEIQSAVMSEDGTPIFEYHVFDIVDGFVQPGSRYSHRYGYLSGRDTLFNDKIKLVQHKDIETIEQLLEYETLCISNGYEGIMIRSLDGPYKCGRSTLKEGYLLKLKRFQDTEATITGFTERMHNGNEIFTDELGHSKRSSHKSNKIGTNMLGALQVKLSSGISFEVGTGFSESQRIEYWNNKNKLLNTKIKFKFQELSKDGIPRFPVFIGFRSDIDIG